MMSSSKNSEFYAFDVVTLFHLISAVSFFLYKGVSGDRLFLYTIKNMNGEFLIDEKNIEIKDGMYVSIIHQGDSRFDIKNITLSLTSFFSLMVGNNKVHIGHHTYFKPSVIFRLNKSVWVKGFDTFSFEEGVGTYNSLAQEKEVALREGKKFYREKFFLKKVLSSRAFVKNKWGILSDEMSSKSRDFYLMAIKEVASNYYAEYSLPETGSDRCGIYFTSPFVGLNVISEKENRLIIKNVVNFFEEKGIFLYIKPHPLDGWDYSEFKREGVCDIMDSSLPSEILLCRSQFELVAGINSGALLTSSIIYGIKSINFYSLLPNAAKKKIKLGESLQEKFQKHVFEYGSDD